MLIPGRFRAAIRGAALLALLGSCPARLPAQAADAALPVREVAAGVFLHQGKPLAPDARGHEDIANVGFIVGSRCVAVIDTGGSVRVGRALRASVRSHTHLPVCYVINTHVHFDHVLGNLAFVADKPRFIGHENLAPALTRSREFFLTHYAQDLDAPATAAEIVAPTQSVALDAETELNLGGRVLRLHAWPRAHTDCDLTVYDSATRTLWTGDLLFVQRTPALDGSLTGWLAVMDSLGQLQGRVGHVVPGHGAAGDDLSAALEPQRRYLRGLLDEVRGEIAHGDSLEEALKRARAPQASPWQLWDETHPRNVARAYQELEWE